MLIELPFVLAMFLVLYTIQTKSSYGLYMLISLMVMHQTIIYVKYVGLGRCYLWDPPQRYLSDCNFCSRVLTQTEDLGRLPSAHIATMSFIATMWYLEERSHWILVFMSVLTYGVWRDMSQHSCHTHIQMLAGLIYGGLFGWFMFSIKNV